MSIQPFSSAPAGAQRSRLSRAVSSALAIGFATGLGLAAAAPAAAAAPTAAAVKRYEIPAGTLDQALNSYARSAGILLAIDGSLTAGKTSRGLSGDYSVGGGLAALLAGSGLEAVAQANGGYALRRQPAAGTTQLETLRIQGNEQSQNQGYTVKTIRSATKTDTPLRDTPQAITVVTQELIRDAAMQNIGDVTRYMPGVGIAQGEGNRDTPILRGNSTTADFFTDGIRDDAQYFRDLYNVERVEAIKGPNAMIFGRGGTGGVINRVTKQADGRTVRELTLQAGSWDDRRITGDIGQALSDSVAFRVTGMYEKTNSYRDGFELERWGINPTVAFALGASTTLTLSYEHFEDDRTADRGIPSFAGKPVKTDDSTFFGDPHRSPTWVDVDTFSALLEHDFGNDVVLTNRTRYADYDKFYQNVYPNSAVGSDGRVEIAAYNNATQRENLFNQTDLTFKLNTGAIEHQFLAGLELGRQDTDNFRETGFFTGGTTATTHRVPVSYPRTALPINFRQNTNDADNTSEADVAAIYLQDQIEFSEHFQAVLGARYDRFDVDFRNKRNGQKISVDDDFVSPRVGLIYKPIEPVSIYASYTKTYVPRAGEQLASLTATNAAFDPEEFENYEIGAKWDVLPELSATIAVYRLDRTNVAVPDPVQSNVTNLVDGQRTDGVELGLSGQITEAWQVMGGYAYQDGEITETQSSTALKGATLAQTPKHSFSLWNRYDFTAQWGVGLGVIYRDKIYTSTDNTVSLGSFTRVDGAVFYTLNDNLSFQLNVENLFDEEYYASAHNNNNITPGSPRAFRVGMTANF